jgi:two-component system sensor histidine kinase KdpD
MSRAGICLACLAGVSVCTWGSFRLGLDLASVGFLYLIFVVLAAVYGGFWQATVLSVVSVICLDFFFDEPKFSLSVGRLSDWVELGAFEFTALVISRLSNSARMRALEAVTERRDTTRLYETARRMLLIDNYSETGNRVATLIQHEFQLRGVVAFDASPAMVYDAGEVGPEIVRQAQDAYIEDADKFDITRRTWTCVLRLGTRPMGALTLCGTDMSELTARALASLCAIALERARALDRQNHAEAERQAEKLRTAVLDSLAHKVKTPLTVIRTALAGLPAAGSLSELQTELVSLVDQEAKRLNELAHRLVGARDPDSREFEPQPEPLLLSHLVKDALGELDLAADRERFRLMMPASEPTVLADRELILTAMAQLVDNALKYSLPASPVEIAVKVRESSVVMTVRSQGLVVAPQDRERIFDRFYRAPGAQSCAAGTGLGLSIVKTIAADHRGHVWADSEPGYGTTFSLSLPKPQGTLQ